MSDGFLNESLRGVDWGVATADTIAAPPPPPPEQGGHFRQWTDDIGQLLGVTPDTHRMVAGWPRLQPEGPEGPGGPGGWDREALDRCDRALDALLAQGKRPALTLFDRTLPPWLDAAGGWLARDTAEHFAAYAAELGRRFGDRVERWITSTDLAGPTLADHVAGMYSPGRGAGRAGLPAVHHILLANGLATQALGAVGVRGRIGTTITLVGGYAATDDPYDRLALERLESWTNRIFLDPLLLGEHMVTEEDVSPVAASGCVRPGDMEIIATAQDLLGLSWHTPFRVTAPENLPRVLPTANCRSALNEVNRLLVGLGFAIVPFDDVETTAYGWPIIPEGLADAVAGLYELYGDLLPPLSIVDNGMGDLDLVDDTGHSDDTRRRALLRARLSWLAGIVAAGVEVCGYEYWSVLDNLEAKFRYTRLYAMAVPDHEVAPGPTMPSDWLRSGTFAAAPAACPESRLSLVPRTRAQGAGAS
ncbi:MULTISPECIES: family 1 glycosylhydrolase [unclassified Streptomyces]|uniref:family 1 glycosylhydrolase n=1 Tax=unclassified Streptomyces TaxID=2593676 RepID=UPI002E77BD38|nr:MULTISPECIES: family 1 glycosylhydrolase [unclassified Streptomyces]MEE1762821.1 family 1 glycosylhydrolase [Streptomyces sp. SP18BB07]MEE1833035.1 family 1 glycosylhydrolase [Streptomyces sp. SP17KL33]